MLQFPIHEDDNVYDDWWVVYTWLVWWVVYTLPVFFLAVRSFPSSSSLSSTCHKSNASASSLSQDHASGRHIIAILILGNANFAWLGLWFLEIEFLGWLNAGPPTLKPVQRSMMSSKRREEPLPWLEGLKSLSSMIATLQESQEAWKKVRPPRWNRLDEAGRLTDKVPIVWSSQISALGFFSLFFILWTLLLLTN